MSSLTREMTVSEIVELCPSASEVLLEYGLHCIGCGASSWETLEDGAYSHGMSTEGIDDLMQELNELYKIEQSKMSTPTENTPASPPAITQKDEVIPKNYPFPVE